MLSKFKFLRTDGDHKECCLTVHFLQHINIAQGKAQASVTFLPLDSLACTEFFQ